MTKKFKKILIATIITLSVILGTTITVHSEALEKQTEYYDPSDYVIVNGLTIHHISDEGICGATMFGNDFMPYEGYTGLKVKTDGMKINCTAYSHTDSYAKGGKISINQYNAYCNDKTSGYNLGSIKIDETKTFDLTEAFNKIKFKSGTKDVYVLAYQPEEDGYYIRMYLYYDGEKVHHCHYNYNTSADIKKWKQLTDPIDPETCLDMYVGGDKKTRLPIVYPCYIEEGDGVCHVKEWSELSDKLIKKDSWPDELKLYVLTEWFVKNCAFDNYRFVKNNNTSRAMLKGDWNDNNLWLYYNHVGVCSDFSNALTIMCRAQGIPCTTVENSTHALNAVFINGEWVAVDVTALLQYDCDTEDTSKSKWTERDSKGGFNQFFGYYDNITTSYNQSLFTKEIIVKSGSGKNPL